MNNTKLSNEDIKELDKKYYIHSFFGEKNYNPIIVNQTQNNTLITSDGKSLLDFSSQIVCLNLGNGISEIKNQMIDALNTYGFHWEQYLSELRSLAVKSIIEDIPTVKNWASKLKFFNTGGEAIDGAVSLARLISKKRKILAKRHDFHGGWTKEALSRSTIEHYGSMKDLETGMIYEMDKDNDYITIPSGFCERCELGNNYCNCSKMSTLPCVKETEDIINKNDPKDIAACLLELVSGFGVVFPNKDYIIQLSKLLKKYDILLIDDEVLTGFGRLGEWFAYNIYDGIYPDIMCLGKGLSNSMIPTSAIVVNKKIGDYLENNIWYIGSTFSAHPVAMAAIIATIEYMNNSNIIYSSRQIGEYIEKKLDVFKKKFDIIDFFKGMGCYWQIELKTDIKNTRKVNIENIHSPGSIVITECAKQGLMLGGLLTHTVRLSPSLTITNEEIDRAFNIMENVFDMLSQ